MDILDVLGCAMRAHSRDGNYRICFHFETEKALHEAYGKLVLVMVQRAKSKAMIAFRDQNRDLSEGEFFQLAKDMHGWGPEDWSALAQFTAQ